MNVIILLGLITLPIGQLRVLPSTANTSLVKSIVQLQPGHEYKDEDIASSIKKLYQTGYFNYVAIDTSLVDSSVYVTIQVEQPPRLNHVEIVGNRKLRTRKLLDEIKADSASVLSTRQIFKWEHKIRELYKKKSYLLAKVNSRFIETDHPGLVDLRIEIEEGHNVKIRKVSFIGNNHIPSIKLERSMKNRSRNFFRSGRFDDKKFKEDIDRIEALYHDKGWVDAKVSEVEMPIDSLGNLDIVIHIEEGGHFITGRFSFEGVEAIPESTLVKSLLLKESEPYSLTLVQMSLDRLKRAYWEEGYLYASINPIETLRGDTVDVRYVVKEGKPSKVRRIVIKGNYRIRDNTIRREIMLLPGSTFKYSLAERSQRNIYNIGQGMALFENVTFYPEDVAGEENMVDIIFVVKEKSSGQVSAGVSYGGKETGIMGNVEIFHPNVFGGAELGQLKLEKGTKLTQALIGLTSPRIFDSPTLLGGQLYYISKTQELYDSKKSAYEKITLGGLIRTSRSLPLDYTRGGITFKVERIDIDSVAGRANNFPTGTISGFNPSSYPKNTISTTFNITRDSRDYFVNPSSGSYLSQSIEFAGGILGGDVNFIKEKFDYHMNFPIAWDGKVVFTQKFSFGYLTGYSAADTIPLYERFRPGGTSAHGVVRGYSDASLGSSVNGALIGGKAMTVFNTELKVKITPQIALIGFFDAGNAWETLGQVNLSELKKGVGAGVRFEVPFVGVLGFDAGIGLDYPKGTTLQERFRPHFQISRTF